VFFVERTIEIRNGNRYTPVRLALAEIPYRWNNSALRERQEAGELGCESSWDFPQFPYVLITYTDFQTLSLHSSLIPQCSHIDVSQPVLSVICP
jgi:hypothetical protein